MNKIKVKRLKTDVLIIGGGTAGCYSAITIAENSVLSVLIAEKANIKRSGCLAAGVNALNAYIVRGKTPDFYVDYAKKDAEGIVREDLLLSMAEGLNKAAEKLEAMGLVILKDENGEYMTRGNRNIKINGENIKPILAAEVQRYSQIKILNYVNVIDYLVKDNEVLGAFAVSLKEKVLYEIRAKKVICATGGASGLYRPNNPGFSKHKMWYSPFNTGAGYAMGIRNGAEMTTFEMRFVALRCKDTIAPTGTIAQGVGARQINSAGEMYETEYGATTSERVYGTVKENLSGKGPCYLKTVGINKEQNESLKKAYLNMNPSQTLKWLESGKEPSKENVEIEGTEPYVVGGHTASGYWVDINRETTIKDLFAAGDVAGGCPQKYVTGALAEGEIAAKAIIRTIGEPKVFLSEMEEDVLLASKQKEIELFLNNKQGIFTCEDLEESMQKVMDEYAGGIKTSYGYTARKLDIAAEKIVSLWELSHNLRANDMQELMYIYELRERITVCRTLIAHLKARKETRWHCFAENLDYPKKDKKYLKYVNSRLVDGKIKILLRNLVGREEKYEHSYR